MSKKTQNQQKTDISPVLSGDEMLLDMIKQGKHIYNSLGGPVWYTVMSQKVLFFQGKCWTTKQVLLAQLKHMTSKGWYPKIMYPQGAGEEYIRMTNLPLFHEMLAKYTRDLEPHRKQEFIFETRKASQTFFQAAIAGLCEEASWFHSDLLEVPGRRIGDITVDSFNRAVETIGGESKKSELKPKSDENLPSWFTDSLLGFTSPRTNKKTGATTCTAVLMFDPTRVPNTPTPAAEDLSTRDRAKQLPQKSQKPFEGGFSNVISHVKRYDCPHAFYKHFPEIDVDLGKKEKERCETFSRCTYNLDDLQMHMDSKSSSVFKQICQGSLSASPVDDAEISGVCVIFRYEPKETVEDSSEDRCLYDLFVGDRHTFPPDLAASWVQNFHGGRCKDGKIDGETAPYQNYTQNIEIFAEFLSRENYFTSLASWRSGKESSASAIFGVSKSDLVSTMCPCTGVYRVVWWDQYDSPETLRQSLWLIVISEDDRRWPCRGYNEKEKHWVHFDFEKALEPTSRRTPFYQADCVSSKLRQENPNSWKVQDFMHMVDFSGVKSIHSAILLDHRKEDLTLNLSNDSGFDVKSGFKF